jgi:hypothetical protein
MFTPWGSIAKNGKNGTWCHGNFYNKKRVYLSPVAVRVLPEMVPVNISADPNQGQK